MSGKKPASPSAADQVVDLYRRKDAEHWQALEHIVQNAGL